MSIIYNSAVTGVNTPIAITGNIADRPLPTTQPQGTIYIAADTQQIYTQDNGFWRQVASVGGGGGSQNLEQVLTTGNKANYQKIVLDSVSEYSTIQQTDTSNNFEGLIKFNPPQINNIGKQYFLELFNNYLRQYLLRRDITNNIEDFVANYIDANNNYYLQSSTEFNFNFYKEFKVDAKYGGDLKAVLTNNRSGGQEKITLNCNDNNCFIQLSAYNNDAQITVLAVPTDAKLTIYDVLTSRETKYFSDRINVRETTGGNIVDITYTIPAAASTTIFTPEWGGMMANVNERILLTAIDLSVASVNVQGFGVYQINVGSNTNDLIFDDFITNGADGEFVTLCVADTPVRCVNTLGTIFGTANINSKGLYKLMKIGNDIYSSHI